MSRIPRTLPVQGNFYEAVQYGYVDITFEDAGVAKSLGIFPAGATIIKPISGFNTDVAFNDSGIAPNNYVDIGTAADPDLYGTELDASVIGFVPLDEAVAMTLTADTELFATLTGTVGDATAGSGRAIIYALIPVDGEKSPNPPSNP